MTVTLGVSLPQSLQEVGSHNKGWLRCLVTTPSKSLIRFLVLGSVLGISVGSRNWNRAGSQAWAQLLCLSLALDNLCFGSICLSSSGGVLWCPTCLITIPTTVMNNAAMSWAPNHVPRTPLALFCTLCPSSGQPFKTRLYYLHFADETTAADETTVTFLRLLIHSVTIWGFNLGLTYSIARILSSVYPSSRYWTCRAGNRHNFQASECIR